MIFFFYTEPVPLSHTTDALTLFGTGVMSSALFDLGNPSDDLLGVKDSVEMTEGGERRWGNGGLPSTQLTGKDENHGIIEALTAKLCYL